MKRVSFIAVTIAMLTYPFICAPSYLIQLTNGNQFIIDRYEEEESQIRFYSHGGSVGIPRVFVERIKESDVTIENQIDKTPIVILSPKPPNTSQADDELAEETSQEEEGGDQGINFEYYKQEQLRLKAKVDKALARFWEASQHKDSKAKHKAVEDMTKASGELYHLADEMKEKHKGALPDWWAD